MNYNSFLKRDYKSISLRSEIPQKRLKRYHIALMVIAVAIVGMVLISIPDQAVATKQSISPVGIEKNDSRITVALDIPFNSHLQLTSTPIVVDSHASAQQVTAWTDYKIRRGDSMSLIFKRHHIDAAILHDIMSLGSASQALKKVQPGQRLQFRFIEKQLQEMVYVQDRLNSLRIIKFAHSYHAIPLQKTLDTRINRATVTIRTSLFEAGLNAELSNSLIMDVAGIFGWDIDFALDIRNGDQFTVLYEEHYLDGKKLRDGSILAAEFVNQNRRYQAIRYTDNQNRTDYYTPNGLSMRKAFLRTPVDFKRISSRFGKRRHPVLNRMRVHKGVDYAASRGTPVKSSGDGKIIFKGRKGGYGRCIIIKHGGRYSTLYAHLNSYKRGIRVGKKVKQAQVIAFVGSSGRTTGSHLHYEFRVNGIHRNPLTIRLPNARPINKNIRDDFMQYAQNMLQQLAIDKPVDVASNP